MARIDTTDPSPFHAGERAVQARFGLAERAERRGRRVIRDHLPDQHRAFYPLLPFLLIGMVDSAGRPWASLVPGKRGFLNSPGSRTLRVGALGIELETRRRNRLAGVVRESGADGFAIEVRQSFGNCPQYILARAVEAREARPGRLHEGTSFDAASASLIGRADTLFIASAHLDDSAGPGAGADVSHRGGRPGFVAVEDESTLVLPDFQGNNHFNTLGNLVADPRAGLLFANFDTGDLVQATGEAEIVWDGPEVDAFPGAQRLLRFRAANVRRLESALPFRFTLDDYSPSLAKTGVWAEVRDL